jgi:hypothetical protein
MNIKEKLSLGYHYLGEQEVKNISEPVRVYRLLTYFLLLILADLLFPPRLMDCVGI